jgi:hypothetical protein
MNLDDTPETYANLGWAGMQWDTLGRGTESHVIADIAGIAVIGKAKTYR